MKLATARRKYHLEWMAFRYRDKTKKTGDVIAHHKSNRKLHELFMALNETAHVYITYNGPVVPKGYALFL